MSVHVKSLSYIRKYQILSNGKHEHILIDTQPFPDASASILSGDAFLFSLLNVDCTNLKSLTALLNTCFSQCSIGIPVHHIHQYNGKPAFPLSCLREQIFLIKAIVECVTAIQKDSPDTLLDWFGGVCCTAPLVISTDHVLSHFPHTSVSKKRAGKEKVPLEAAFSERIAQKLPFQVDITAQTVGTLFSKEAFLDGLSNTEKMVLYQEAMDICTEIINHQIQHIRYELVPCWNNSSCHFKGIWQANSGFSSAYYELYEKLTHKKPIRQCANTTCRNYFEVYGNDTRKIYCSLHCAQLQCKRNLRARKK